MLWCKEKSNDRWNGEPDCSRCVTPCWGVVSEVIANPVDLGWDLWSLCLTGNIAIGNKKLSMYFIASLVYLFIYLVFGPQSMWDLSSPTGIKPGIKTAPPALEGKVLTAAPPGAATAAAKSLQFCPTLCDPGSSHIFMLNAGMFCYDYISIPERSFLYP